NLLSHVGKSPEVTMGARLAATLKKGGEENPLIRVKPGVFALREWDEETIKQGLEVKRSAKKKANEEEAEAVEVEEIDVEEAGGSEPPPASEEEIEVAPPAPDEEMRAESAASATEVFAEEADDDQPILKPADEEPSEGRGRRRRR